MRGFDSVGNHSLCLTADDMGLGKTLTMISLVMSKKPKEKKKKKALAVYSDSEGSDEEEKPSEKKSEDGWMSKETGESKHSSRKKLAVLSRIFGQQNAKQ